MYTNITTGFRNILPLLLFTIMVSEGCGNKTAPDQSPSDTATSHIYSEEELPLPAIPDSLTLPEDRAAYAAAHFWNNLDFRNDTRCLDTVFMEQNFANFLAVTAYATENDAQYAIDRLLDNASTHSRAEDLIDHIAAKYLDDPNSPMRSEELYVLFLKHTIADGNSDEAKKIRAIHRLGMAMKNRVGSKATDFRLITKEGNESRLLEIAGRDTTLIMFYDPECEQCRVLTARLKNSGTAGRYRVVAVDVASDRQLWEKTKDEMPSDWISAFALEAIEDDEKYYLPALPSLYLIAPDGTVIIKDLPLSALN